VNAVMNLRGLHEMLGSTTGGLSRRAQLRGLSHYVSQLIAGCVRVRERGMARSGCDGLWA
jgi:hypothetical protein